MAGQQFMGLDMRKSFFWLSIIVLGLIALTGSSCNPKQSSPDPPPATVTIAQEALSLEDGSDLNPLQTVSVREILSRREKFSSKFPITRQRARCEF